MADMTKEDFNEQADALGPNPDKEAVSKVLQGIGSLDEFDSKSLDKLVELLEGLGSNLPEGTQKLADSLTTKIIARREQIAQSAAEPPTAETPAAPQQETPKQEEKLEDIVEREFDAMTSYDIAQLHKIAREQFNVLSQKAEKIQDPNTPEAQQIAVDMAKNDRMIKDIETYVKTELSQTTLGEHNAPTVSDYVEIMTAADPEYKYEDAQKLKFALADYDKTNGLDGELPSTKDIATYSNVWGQEFQKLSAQAKDLSPEDRTVFDTLNTMVLTELVTEEPDTDKEKVAQRYKEKFDEIQAKFNGAVNTTLLLIQKDPTTKEQEEEWRKRFLAAKQISAAELKKIVNDPERSLILEKEFEAYCTREVKLTIAGVMTTKNAVYASRMSRKAGMANTFIPAAMHHKTMFEKHPEYMQAAKQTGKMIAIKGIATLGFGIIGATAAQGWQLTNTFKKEIKACKEQNGGKLSPKIFAKYLKKNPEAIVNIARSSLLFTTAAVATVALVASGAATFGLVGGIAGFAATNVAGGLAIKGIKAAVAGGITAVTGGITAYITNKKRKPLKKELMDILRQSMQEDPSTQKKGLLARFKKTPAEKVYSELTAMIKNGDEKMSATFDKYNLPPEHKERVMQLAKEIKALNLKATAVVASTALGSAATAFMMEYNQNAGNSGGSSNWSMDKTFAQNAEANKYVSDFEKNNTVEQVPLKPGEHLSEQPVAEAEKPAFRVPYEVGHEPQDIETVTLPADSFEPRGDMWYATQMGPTVLKEKLEAMGMEKEVEQLQRNFLGERLMAKGVSAEDLEKMDIKEMQEAAGIKYIPTPVMADYLKTAQFTPEQAKELQAFVHDRQSFDIERDRINLRDGYNPHARSGVSHAHTGNGGNGGNGGNAGNIGNGGTQQLKGADLSQLQKGGASLTGNNVPGQAMPALKQMEVVTGKTESGGWLKRIFTRRHEQTFVVPAGKTANSSIENYIGQKAMADYNAKHPDNPITSSEAMRQHGYNVKGTVNGQKVHIKVEGHEDGSTTTTRTINGVKSRIHEMKDNLKSKIAIYNNKFKVSANTVGDTNGTEQDTKLGGFSDNSGKSTTFYQDGNNHKVYKEEIVNGQKTVTETNYTPRKVKSMLKDMYKSLRGRS